MGTTLIGGSGKIRLICSSCNQEFTSTSELNEHMERHNSEIDQVLLQHTASSSISTASINIVPMTVSSTFTNSQPRSLMTNNRVNNNMMDMEHHQNACNWNENNTPQDISINMVASTSNSSSSFTPSIFNYQQPSYQTTQTSHSIQSKKCHLENRSSVLTSNNQSFPKTDMNSSISLDSIIPSITSDHMPQETVNTTKELSTPTSTKPSISNHAFADSSKMLNESHFISNKQTPEKEQSTPFVTSTPVSTLPSSAVRKECEVEHSETLKSIGKKSPNEPPSPCSECNLVFKTGVDLRKHIDLIHQGRQGGKKYQCAICTVEFDEKTDLKNHLEKHALEKPFKCDICGVRFANQAGQKRHKMRIHDTKSKPYSCDKCGKEFFDKHDLKRHVKVHTKECSKCGKRIGPAGITHICDNEANKNKDETENPELKCTICGIMTSNKMSWGYHMWKHTKDPKYISLPVNVDTLRSPSNKSKEVNSDGKYKELVKVTTKKPTHSLKNGNTESAIARIDPTRNAKHNYANMERKQYSIVKTSSSQQSSSSSLDEKQLNPPDAHATSYSQISQPLCLQTSVRKPILPEKEIKPLNMQIVNS